MGNVVLQRSVLVGAPIAGIAMGEGIARGADAIVGERRSHGNDLNDVVPLAGMMGTTALASSTPGVMARGWSGAAALRPAAIVLGLAGASSYMLARGLVTQPGEHNTMDTGLNRLEQGSFDEAHRKRLELALPIGGVLGTIGGATFLTTRLTGTSNPLLGAAFGMIGGLAAGAGVAAYMTTGGQTEPYASSTGDIDVVADELARGVFIDDATTSVDARMPDDKHLPTEKRPSRRTEVGADKSYFYAQADASGNGDGKVDRAEIRARVATFDADHNGTVDAGDEWTALHAAVVA